MSAFRGKADLQANNLKVVGSNPTLATSALRTSRFNQTESACARGAEGDPQDIKLRLLAPVRMRSSRWLLASLLQVQQDAFDVIRTEWVDRHS